jgi:hypothetical protein
VADDLVVNPQEQAAMTTVRAMLASGTSLRKCGAWLDDQGFKPRRAARWSAQSLKNMLTSKMATAAPRRPLENRPGMATSKPAILAVVGSDEVKMREVFAMLKLLPFVVGR